MRHIHSVRMATLKELRKTSSLVGRAYIFAKEAHAGQKRLTGEPYFSHAEKTAEYLAEWGLDETTVAGGLLHDVVEDTDATLETVKKEFGEDIAHLVDGVTKLGQVKYRGDKAQIENLRKLIVATAEDIRVLLIKLADRRHNMKTLSPLPREKQKRIAAETMEIYAPLAYQLGMQQLAGELQDLAFPYIYPKEYRWLLKHLQERYEERERYLAALKPIVEAALEKAGIDLLAIDFRAKRYASLYKKLLQYEMDIEKIYDIVAFRIIVKSVEDCYATLGVIHSLWPPLPGRFKDYIATPKPNGYRSLHTTVLGPNQKIIEFQVRTKEMHEEAEYGIAAHWAYKEGKQRAPRQELAFVKKLRSWQQEIAGATGREEFLEAFKIDFAKDRILAITPKGEVVDLPYGATPVDFAYRIHTEVGNQCVGAKVNGKIVPLDYKLHSSDVVEIITQKNKKPSPSWLDFVVTSTARAHIKNSIKSSTSGGMLQERKKHAELKITAEDRVGLLADISRIISRSHVNILSVHSAPRKQDKFHTIRVKCDTEDRDKVWKIILKLKALKEVKEIDYRFV